MERRVNLTGNGFAKDLIRIGISEITSILGIPYFMDVVIDGLRLQNEPKITIIKQKQIVSTPIVGSESLGTVKEFISAGDYKITVEGVIKDPLKRGYPQEAVDDLIRVLKKREALEFSNQIAELLGIYTVVVKSYGFGKDVGKPYSQSYKIDLISDEDFYGILSLRNL